MHRVTVQQISDVDLQRARIVYLSACSTAENTRTQLNHEVMHLASSLQVAGFEHVVGSVRSSEDETTVEVAKGVYEQLADA